MQLSAFSSIFKELPSLAFSTQLVLLSLRVSLILIGLAPLMIGIPHQALSIALVLLLLLGPVRNN